MTGYTVKPRGVVSQFKHGGFVVFEENGHGLVVSVTDLGKQKWEIAKTACQELLLNGYSDWHLPSKEELYSVYVNLKQPGLVNFNNGFYWSSSKIDDYYILGMFIEYGEWSKNNSDYGNYVAVRSF
jgi:hypothetical protein